MGSEMCIRDRSSGDNSNILAARVARETFGVTNVAARIYDPRRAQIFERPSSSRATERPTEPAPAMTTFIRRPPG